VLVSGIKQNRSVELLVDQMAFRIGSLNDLRTIRSSLINTGIVDINTVSHGNAWSIYFYDLEGNGVECFVDSPFHVAQPIAAEGFNLDMTDEEILEWTREICESGENFQPMSQWKKNFQKN